MPCSHATKFCPSPKFSLMLIYIYRPHTEYDGKVMFSVCLSTGGPPNWGGGAPRGYPPNWGGTGGTPPTGGGRPRGYPPNWGGGGGCPQGYPPNLDKNVGQNFEQKMDKHFGNFWSWGGAGGTPLAVTQEDCLVENRISVQLCLQLIQPI